MLLPLPPDTVEVAIFGSLDAPLFSLLKFIGVLLKVAPPSLLLMKYMSPFPELRSAHTT
jgi:hypothetical protein